MGAREELPALWFAALLDAYLPDALCAGVEPDGDGLRIEPFALDHHPVIPERLRLLAGVPLDAVPAPLFELLPGFAEDHAFAVLARGALVAVRVFLCDRVAVPVRSRITINVTAAGAVP